jgi:hypothetical protein
MITIHQPPRPAAAQPAKPLDLFVCPFVVAVDTREQAPWPFGNLVIGGKQWIVKREVKTLSTGDYSIVGCEDRICIERKSPEDFTSTISTGNARFRAEHERMQAIIKDGAGVGHFCCTIVEGCMAAICDELDSPTSGRRITSDVVIGWTASWPRRYQVPIFFAGDRRRAELLAFRILWKWWDDVGRLIDMEGNTLNGEVAS